MISYFDRFGALVVNFFINSIPAQTLASTVLNRQKSASTMATKPPLPPSAAAAALPHTALPPSPQPRGCPPWPFPRIPVAATPLCAAHTPSPTTTCVLTLRHDDFSPSWAILKSSSASQPTQTPTMYQWSIGYAGGGITANVDVQYCHKVPSALVMADSSSLLERVGGCSSPNNPFCHLGEPTTMNFWTCVKGKERIGLYSAGFYGRTSRGELLHLLSVLMSGGSNDASFTFIPLCFT